MLLHSINSICHVFGRRRFATANESRNVIRGLEACGLAWDGVRISPDRQARKALGAGRP
jgi:hypothetical protein